MDVLNFYLDEDGYLIDTKYLKTIIKYQKINKVPGGKPFLAGIIVYEGEVIPVLNIRFILGINGEPDNELAQSIIITQIDDLIIGMLADKVGELFEIDKKQVIKSDENQNFIVFKHMRNKKIENKLDLEKIINEYSFSG